MGANNYPYLQKCGEVLIDVNSKHNKNKDYIFHCIFCNLEYEQLNKFSLHIEEEHLDNFEDVLIDAEVKGEEIECPSYNLKSSIENEAGRSLEQDVLNVAVKEEVAEDYKNETILCDDEVKDCVTFISDCDEEVNQNLGIVKRSSDTTFAVVSDTDDEIEQVHHKRRKTNSFEKRRFTKLKDITCETSSDESTDGECNVSAISLLQIIRNTSAVLTLAETGLVRNLKPQILLTYRLRVLTNSILTRIFKNNPIYAELRAYYHKYGHLGSAEQNKLSRAIIDYYVSRRIKLPSTYLKKLASQIVKLFPSEAEEIYFEKQSNQRAKGKLYFRYQNMMKIRWKPHKLPPHFTGKNVSLRRKEKGANKIKYFLKHNFTNRDETLRSWEQCIDYRLKELIECKEGNIANVIKNWPAYKQSFGPELVGIDFGGLFPGRSNKFTLNWTKLNMILPTYFNMNLKDMRLKSIWLDAKGKWSNLDQNSKDALFIYILHGILKPERFANFGKVTIAESQLATIKFTEDEIDTSSYDGQSPFLLIKKNYFNVEKIFVIADPITYKMNTVSEALALCFKIHQIFNIKYNRRCINFWLFIQKILFEIHFEDDYVGTSLRSITSFFESQK